MGEQRASWKGGRTRVAAAALSEVWSGGSARDQRHVLACSAFRLPAAATVGVCACVGPTAAYGPTLVVVPAELETQWAQQMRKYVPQLKVCVLSSLVRSKPSTPPTRADVVPVDKSSRSVCPSIRWYVHRDARASGDE